MKRPVIAHVLHRLYLAGAEVLAAALSRRLRDRFDFLFLCLDEIGPLGRQLASEGFTVIDLHRKPGVDRQVPSRIKRIVREHDVRLLHAHQYTPFFYASISRGLTGLLRSRPRVLFTEHGRHYPDIRKTKRVFANKLLLRRKDRVTAVGNFVKQALVTNEGINPRRIEVVYNGIDPRQFTFDATGRTRAAVRSELNIPENQPVLLQVARFHPVKDHATAIRAFASALKQGQWNAGPAPLFVLVGDGDKKDEMHALVAELKINDHVRFLGVRSDIPQLMAAADVFTLSSLSEGVSVTLLESMGAAVPIAATDVGGNGEVVEANVTGLLSPRGDHEGLGRNLLTLLTDSALRRRMGDAGRARLLQRFTEEEMHKRYAAIYEEMLSGERPA